MVLRFVVDGTDNKESEKTKNAHMKMEINATKTNTN
jgi:hypothetical protein